MARTRRRTALLLFLSLVALVVLAPMLTDAQESGTPAAPAAATPDPLIVEGEAIFGSVCIACHQAGGKGVDGVYPALAGNALVNLEDPRVMTTTVLYGRGGMPRFNTLFTSEQTAAVISYVRSELDGNNASPITAEYVDQVRLETESVLTPTAEPVSADGQDPAASPTAGNGG